MKWREQVVECNPVVLAGLALGELVGVAVRGEDPAVGSPGTEAALSGRVGHGSEVACDEKRR